jgi:GxxExxY protein
MSENEISFLIIGKALEIHKSVGPGLLESAYESALTYELEQSGFKVESQKAMPFVYKEVKQETGYRLDLLVEDKVIVEIKSVEKILPVHYSQLHTYLRLSGKKLGLLINFNTKYLKNDIHRVVNNL